MLSANALAMAETMCRLAIVADDLLSTGDPGDEDEAREMFRDMARVAREELPVIRGIIAAHRQAAERLNLSQRAVGVQPAPYPAPANDTHSVTPSAPSLA